MMEKPVSEMTDEEKAAHRAEFERMRDSLPEAVEVHEPAAFQPGVIGFLDGSHRPSFAPNRCPMKSLLLALMFSTLAVLSTPAVAQDQGPPCAPYDEVAARLAAEFMETRVAQGVTSSGQAMLAIFASPDGATWTAVMIRPGGLACMAAAGMDWQIRSDPAPVQEEGL